MEVGWGDGAVFYWLTGLLMPCDGQLHRDGFGRYVA